MSTFLAKEGLCGNCGRRCGAEGYQCSCKGVHFCDSRCQKAAWPVHRLTYSAARPSKKSGFGVGDIVEISGLKSEAGRKMNGLLAEVFETGDEGGRVGVLVAVEDGLVIKSARLKPDNLTLRLATHEAAANAAKTSIRANSVSDPDTQRNFELKVISVAQKVPSLSGADIVRRIDEEEEHVLQALVFPASRVRELGKPPIPYLSATQTESMLRNGLIDVCFRKLRFPEALDVAKKPEGLAPAQLLTLVSNSLNKGAIPNEHLLNRFRVDACRKLGPIILLASSKKHRLYGQPEHWFGLQAQLMALIGNCLIAESLASSILLQSLDRHVTSTLLDHMIFLLTVDSKLYLRKRTTMRGRGNMLHVGCATQKFLTIPVLLEFVDILSVGEPMVRRIGSLVVPPGALPGLVGRKLAECFLDVAALVAYEELGSGQARRGGMQLIEELQYIYSMFGKSPGLTPLLGAFDEEFAYGIRTPNDLQRWADERLRVLTSSTE